MSVIGDFLEIVIGIEKNLVASYCGKEIFGVVLQGSSG